MSELKPCPFCGDESPILKTEFIGELGFSYTKVQCWACGASISAYSQEERAIREWNRRYEPVSEIDYDYEAEDDNEI